MSEHESEVVSSEDDYDYVPGGRRRKGRGLKGCFAVLIALTVLAGGFYFGLTRGVDWVSGQFQGPDDFAGPGSGSVKFTVNEGDTVAQMGRNLKADGVTKSVQAFIDAAARDSSSSGIQVGDYELQKEMKAADALEVLVDPDNLITFPTVTIPEGLRLTEIVSTLAKNTKFKAPAWNRALGQPDKIGLPDYADGNAEGYLFPATYEIKPGMKPVAVLKMMVTRWRAGRRCRRPREQGGCARAHPGRADDHRLPDPGRGPRLRHAQDLARHLQPPRRPRRQGRHQRHARHRRGHRLRPGSLARIDGADADQLAQDTPYNTRINAGLVPTPIEAPGDEAIAAAANPAEGDWYYYVTVDLSTGETKFYEDYDGFLEGRDEYKRYCDTSDRC